MFVFVLVVLGAWSGLSGSEIAAQNFGYDWLPLASLVGAGLGARLGLRMGQKPVIVDLAIRPSGVGSLLVSLFVNHRRARQLLCAIALGAACWGLSYGILEHINLASSSSTPVMVQCDTRLRSNFLMTRPCLPVSGLDASAAGIHAERGILGVYRPPSRVIH